MIQLGCEQACEKITVYCRYFSNPDYIHIWCQNVIIIIAVTIKSASHVTTKEVAISCYFINAAVKCN